MSDFEALAAAGVGAEVVTDGPDGRIHGVITAIDEAARTVTVGATEIAFPPTEDDDATA